MICVSVLLLAVAFNLRANWVKMMVIKISQKNPSDYINNISLRQD
jgi:hypothetical protein